MFSFFVYVAAVLFVLVLVSDGSLNRAEHDRRGEAMPTEVVQTAVEPQCESAEFVGELSEVLPSLEWLFEESEIAKKLKAENAAEIEELISIQPETKPVQWGMVNDRQLRALCQLHDVECSKRGKVNRQTVKRLSEVAA